MKTAYILLPAICVSFTATEKQLNKNSQSLGGIDHGTTLCLSASNCRQFEFQVGYTYSKLKYVKSFHLVTVK